MHQFPFRKTAANADLLKTISEIMAPRGEKPAKPEKKYDKYGAPETTKSGTPQKPQREKYPPVYAKGTTPRVSEPMKTESVTVSESHTRAALEKMSITQLRALLKKYSAKPGSGRELADIRGLLRAKGAGSVLDEGRKGLGKTKYGQALKGLGDAAEKIKANPPKPPVNPFKGTVKEAAPTTAAEWEAANRPSRETAKALQRGMKKYMDKYGKGKPAKPAPSAPVREEMSPCEKSALARLKSANAADLQDKPGAAGQRAHKRLHKTIARVVGEEVESVDEGILGRVKKKIQRAGQAVRTAASDKPSLRTQLDTKRHRHEIAAAAERRKREAEERRKREAEERKHPKPKTKARRSDDDNWSPSSGDDGGWMGAAGI